MADQAFKGFSEKTVTFFEELSKNNQKQWFDEHRDLYDQEVLEPSKLFILAMGERLQELRPGIKAIPQSQ
jgi:uncharacterized protein (DUF2461 family)